MSYRTLAMILSLTLVMFLSCATTQNKAPQAQPDNAKQAQGVIPTDGSFQISLGETKTAYMQKVDGAYKLVRVEAGEQNGKDIVVFTYAGDRSMQTLTVVSHLDEQFITYDCYQLIGNKARRTSIVGAMKNVPSMEMWSDGIKVLLIENIRIPKASE